TLAGTFIPGGQTMRTALKAAATLLVMLVTLAAIEFAPEPETVVRTEGGVRYVEQVDRHGKKHGEQRIYVGDVLSAVRRFDRGDLVVSTEYWPDGSVKSRTEAEF